MFLKLCIGLIVGSYMSFACATDTILPKGQQYLDFIVHLDDVNCLQKSTLLFVSDIKKIINSHLVCNNRDELMQQMFDVWNASGGVKKINLLESISNCDGTVEVIRFEIAFEDGTVESVISILKKDEHGLLCEINEVFGEKCIYQWP